MNLIVGGNLGGTIPDNLNEAVMEIDYVRYFSGKGEGNEGDNSSVNKEDEDDEIIKFETDETLKSPIDFIATDKGYGVVDVVLGNSAAVLADLYVVMIDGEIVKQVGGPGVVTVTVKTSALHTFGIAAVFNGKMSLPTTADLDIGI